MIKVDKLIENWQAVAERARKDFPILATTMNGKPLVYLDNAATTQKPQVVIDALVEYYSTMNANIHRGLYELSQRATDAYEQAREIVGRFLGASRPEECIFVRGTTEAINLVAHSWGSSNLRAGKKVLISGLEHHSNIVPWQLVCEKTGANLEALETGHDGTIDLAQLESVLSHGDVQLLAVQHVSNALGTIHPLEEIVRLAKKHGALVLVDGAQWVAHGRTDVSALGADFYTFSGHKLFAPTGIGVLWGKQELFDQMVPYQGGGDMIDTVRFDNTTYAELPNKFEAGTPDIAGVIGLAAAIEYVQQIGFEAIESVENELLALATERLTQIQGLKIWGESSNKAAVISFTLEEPSIAPLDIATALNNEGIAVRTGHHCCMPLMDQLGVAGTTRMSMAFYNTAQEIEQAAKAINELVNNRIKKLATSDGQGAIEQQGDSKVALDFANAAAESPELAARALIEEFLEFDDKESKTELLMELGDGVPDNFERLKAISPAVPGCMSEVYVVGRPCEADPSRFEFSADSNAAVVRGLIAVLQQIYSGQPIEQILAYDVSAFFREIGLDEFVSTQRRNGLNGMIERIHSSASASG